MMWDYSGIATGDLWQGYNRFPSDNHTRRAGDIIRAVLRVTHVTHNELAGPGRARHASEARQIAYFMLRHHTRLSLPRIGALVGDKHHSTVLYGIRVVAGDYSRFAEKIDAVANALALPPVRISGAVHLREVPFQ